MRKRASHGGGPFPSGCGVMLKLILTPKEGTRAGLNFALCGGFCDCGRWWGPVTEVVPAPKTTWENDKSCTSGATFVTQPVG
ncbi:hypothetical protein HMPREF0298_2270 [Corynebacterium lipophiloflavum DSM 44291]|uniref:Uncharacterized protein n=1 Tax=Corynebacterium lipophiloflavum (strain ATCC 700352 / DSM 44291 / CCUG 37336 / JCM 10383 / DMMZ 1944) TaxID=525263 RepID=C0XV00_CORLD|nr:hypothetical protein HMPREF0298_2270 [Corynebacterium lipophiloflavum DSM 44291]